MLISETSHLIFSVISYIASAFNFFMSGTTSIDRTATFPFSLRKKMQESEIYFDALKIRSSPSGKMFLPPSVTIISFARPAIEINPSSSILPRSPV